MNLEEKILDLLSKSARPLCLQEIATELSLPGRQGIIILITKTGQRAQNSAYC